MSHNLNGTPAVVFFDEDFRGFMDEIIAAELPIDPDEIALDLEEIGRWMAKERPFRA